MNIVCFRDSKFRYYDSGKAITMARLPRTPSEYQKEVCIPDRDNPLFELSRTVFLAFREIGGVCALLYLFWFRVKGKVGYTFNLPSHLKDCKRIFLRREKMKIYKLTKTTQTRGG